MDRTVDRTATVPDDEKMEMIDWQDGEITRLTNENVRQRITILELIRILAPNYGR